jgi:hypothetical protein
MLNSTMYQDDKNIYYNIDIINGRSTSQGKINDPIASFSETRDVPLINDASKYKMSIIRFTMNGINDLPLFIPVIEEGQTNPNKTVYKITVQHNHIGGNVYEFTQPVIWESNDSSLTAPSNFETQGQDATQEYYYCHTYDHFINLVNTTITYSIAQLNALIKVDYPAFTDLIPPFIVYNNANKKFDIYYPADNDAGFSFYFNSNLYNLLSHYPHEYNDLDEVKQYRIIPRNYQGLNSITLNSVDYIKIEQEAVSLGTYWSPISSIVFTSSLLPIISEGVSQPIKFGNSNNANAVSSVSNFEPIITDIALTLDDAYNYKDFLSYIPGAEYRFVSLTNSNQPIRNVNVNIYWKYRLTGQLVPLKLSNLSNISMKFLFQPKY